MPHILTAKPLRQGIGGARTILAMLSRGVVAVLYIFIYQKKLAGKNVKKII